MNKKWRYVIGLGVATACVAGVLWHLSPKSKAITALYPRSEKTFVGDPMPYFDGKDFHIYYLEDLRDNQPGFHPFSLFKTKDFYQYQDYGIVIPFDNDTQSPENALGTGSVFKDKDGLYHAFYTGHNQRLKPKEVIMHATSQNGVDFKKLPEDTFEGSSQYETNDFRDPYVFFEEESQQYWMLITTRKAGKGVVARYTSTDLKTWKDEGVFFENDLGFNSNLECVSLVQFQGKWYLGFSDQSGERVVHYRVADKPSGPFEKPEGLDYVDGAGFYAGRLETDGEKLYVVGWIPTKEKHADRGKYNWAGNLAVHELDVTDKGLSAKVPEKATAQVKPVQLEKQTLQTGAKVTLPTEKTTVYTGKLKWTSEDSVLALGYGTQNHVVIDRKSKTIAYYNVGLDKIEGRAPITKIPFTVDGDTSDVTVVVENDIVVVYVNGVALSNRIYEHAKELTVQAVSGSVEIE